MFAARRRLREEDGQERPPPRARGNRSGRRRPQGVCERHLDARAIVGRHACVDRVELLRGRVGHAVSAVSRDQQLVAVLDEPPERRLGVEEGLQVQLARGGCHREDRRRRGRRCRRGGRVRRIRRINVSGGGDGIDREDRRLPHVHRQVPHVHRRDAFGGERKPRHRRHRHQLHRGIQFQRAFRQEQREPAALGGQHDDPPSCGHLAVGAARAKSRRPDDDRTGRGRQPCRGRRRDRRILLISRRRAASGRRASRSRW